MSRIEKTSRIGPIQELGEDNVIAMLGHYPVYVHSNKRTRQKGLEQVTKLLERTFDNKRQEVEKRIDKLIYGLLSKQEIISNAFGFSSKEEMEEALEQMLQGQGANNKELNNILQSILDLKNILTDTQVLLKATNREDFIKKLKSVSFSLEEHLNQLPPKDKVKFEKLTKTLELVKSLKEQTGTRKDPEKQTLTTARAILRQISSNLGFGMEEVINSAFEENLKEWNKDIESFLVGPERKGGKKQGYAGSDVAIKIPNIEFDLTFSVKLRQTARGKDWTITRDDNGLTKNNYIGSNATKGNLIKYFSTDKQNAFQLNKEERSYLAYGIANSLTNKRYGEFDSCVNSLVVYQRLLFSILGQDWNKKSTTNLPLYIVAMDELYSVPKILNWVKKIKKEELLQLFIGKTGDWDKGQFSENARTEIENKKSAAISNLLNSKKEIKYIYLKEAIKEILKATIENPYDKIFSVRYQILTSNLPKL